MQKADIAKIIIAVDYFCQMFHQISFNEFWISLGFRIYQGSEYVRVTHGRVLNIPQLLNMTDCTWICQNMPEYMWIYLNLPEYALTVLYLSIVIPCLLECTVTYLIVYSELEVIGWRNMRLFYQRNKIRFFHSSWKYFICFLLKTTYFY